MADQKPEIVARFTPQFEGAFMRHVAQGDLTQADVDRMTPQERRDAFTPHPAYGTPLFTAVHPDYLDQQMEFAHAARMTADGLPELTAVPDDATPADDGVAVVTDDDLPKWYQAKVEKAAADGTLIPAWTPGETQRDYDQRIAQFAPPDEDGDEDGVE